jgi:hypothetical protein
VQHEVRGTLNDAWSVQEAVQSIFFQEAIKPTDEAGADRDLSPHKWASRPGLQAKKKPSANKTGLPQTAILGERNSRQARARGELVCLLRRTCRQTSKSASL